jgi:hypothetical protein
MLADRYCNFTDWQTGCKGMRHAAFHPYKNSTDWMSCWKDAGASSQAQAQPKVQAQPTMHAQPMVQAEHKVQPVVQAQQKVQAQPKVQPVVQCEDTAAWNNHYGQNCNNYVVNSWCGGGRAKPGSEWALGKKWNNPEDHCCACGKQLSKNVALPAQDPQEDDANEASTEHVYDKVSRENVELNEHGYQQIAALHDNLEMENFIKRVLHTHHAHVTNEKRVPALAPYHSGTRSVQTFAALVNELKKEPWALGFTDAATVEESDAVASPAPAVAPPAPAMASPAPAVASPAPAVASPAPAVAAVASPAGSDAHLDGAGYQAIAKHKRQNKSQMKMKWKMKRFVAAHRVELVELSQMMPNSSRTQCPNDEVSTVREISFCSGVLRSAEKNNDCIIYNFGVDTADTFLTFLGKEYKNCKIFAFDPSVSEKNWASQGGSKHVFGQNVSFYPWGLYSGQGPRVVNWSHPAYGVTTGELKTLSEIMHELGHTNKRISLLRSDCEGCEWGWISKQMEEDPTAFSRIDQLFTELHFASTLRMDDTAVQQAPVVHKMLHENFAVLKSRANPGFWSDQYKVPKILVDAGVDKVPCCREFALLNKGVLSAP